MEKSRSTSDDLHHSQPATSQLTTNRPIISDQFTTPMRWSKSRSRLRHNNRARTICRVNIVDIERYSGSTVPPKRKDVCFKTRLASHFHSIFTCSAPLPSKHIGHPFKHVRNLMCGLAVEQIAGPKHQPCVFGTQIEWLCEV